MIDEKKIEADELALIPDSLADADKTAGDIWSELAAEEKPAGQPEPASLETDEQVDARLAEEASPAPVEAQPPEAVAPPDIWASAPPELKAAYEAEKVAREKAEREAKSAVGRVAPLQRRLDELRRAAQPAGDDKIKEAREAIRAHEEEYPEIAKPVAKALDAITEKNAAEDKSRREAAATELADIERHATTMLAEKHPDWEAFLNKHGGDGFAAWLDDQPRRIRDAAYRNANSIVDGEGAIVLMDAYKAHVAGQSAAAAPAPAPTPPAATAPNPPTSLDDRRKRQLEATATPSQTGGRPTVTGIPEDGDPEVLWRQIAAEEARQRRA